MKRKAIILFLIINAACFLTACTNKTDKQVQVRDQGIALMESQDYKGAIQKFDKALELSLGRVSDIELDIDYYKAAALFKAGDLAAAKDIYSALIEYDSDNFQPYFLRGSITASEGDMKKAVDDYNAAIQVSPKNYALYIQIYENLASLGQEEMAESYLKKALKIKDNSTNAKYYKGRIYYMLGDYSAAKPLLEEASKKKNMEAKLYLAKVYQATDEVKKAQKLLKEYAASDSVNCEALGVLGDIEMVNENYEEALNYYQAGLSLEPVTNYVQLYRGEVVALERLKRFSEAYDALSAYLKMYPADEDAKRELVFLESRK